MRTVTFKSILHGTAQRLGFDPARDLNSVRAASLTEYINTRLKEGWEFEFWPEWTVISQRQYRLNWLIASAYAAPTAEAAVEVYYPPAQKYYQALQGSTGQVPANLVNGAYVVNATYWAETALSYSADAWQTGVAYLLGDQVLNPEDGRYYQCFSPHLAGASIDLTQFGLLTPFDKFIAYQQTGLGLIAEVRACYRNNPRIQTRTPGRINFVPSDNGIQLPSDAPAIIFVEYRLPPPLFNSCSWNAATTYNNCDVAYSATTGECYRSVQDGNLNHAVTDVAWWKKVNFPAILADFVKRCAVSDGLRDLKQTDRADDEQSNAKAELMDVVDRELAGQSQYDTANVQTFGSQRRQHS